MDNTDRAETVHSWLTKQKIHEIFRSTASTVDIPNRWDPQAKQQPTGLIAYGAARRRPAGLWLPASASCLGRRSRLAGHGPNNDSLFLPQAAVVIVAIPVRVK